MIYILYAIVVISVLLAISDGNSKNNKYFCVLIGFCLACLALSYFPSDYIYNRQSKIKMKRDNIKIVEIPDSLILIYGYRDKETGLIDWNKEIEEGE
jgi:hypothetical protein